MRKGIFTYVFITFLANTTLGNFNNKQDKSIPYFDTGLNHAAYIRKSRHVELATETTLTHILDTIAFSYPHLKATKGQPIEKIKDQIRRKLRLYMKKKKRQNERERKKIQNFESN